MDTDDSQDSREREGTIYYSTLPLPPTHKHSDIYFQLSIWDDYHIFFIFINLFFPLYWITIWLIDVMLSFVSLLNDLILGFCYRNLTWETSGLELALTITLILQADQLTKCTKRMFYFLCRDPFSCCTVTVTGK